MTREIATPRLLAALAWACALAAAACGPGVAEGPIPRVDAGSGSGSDADADTEVETETGTGTEPEVEAATCPTAPVGACGAAPADAFLVLRAADVEEGLAFVDADDGMVLARRTIGGEPAPLIVVGDIGGEEVSELDVFWRAELAGYEGVPVVPIAATARLKAPFTAGGARALILARTPDGNALFRSDACVGFDGEITPVPGGGIPGSGALRGLVYLRRKVIDSSPFEADPRFNRVCAFGDGLYCFDGAAWTTEIAAGSGPPLSALAVMDDGETARIVAVGDDGRAAVETDGAWQALDLGVSVNLRAASAHGGRFTAAGGKGVVVDGTIGERLVCQTYDAAIASLGWTATSEYGMGGDDDTDAALFVALAADGAILHGAVGDGAGSMCDSGGAIPGAFLGRMIDVDYYVLTPDELYVRYYGSGAIVE